MRNAGPGSRVRHRPTPEGLTLGSAAVRVVGRHQEQAADAGERFGHRRRLVLVADHDGYAARGQCAALVRVGIADDGPDGHLPLQQRVDHRQALLAGGSEDSKGIERVSDHE